MVLSEKIVVLGILTDFWYLVALHGHWAATHHVIITGSNVITRTPFDAADSDSTGVPTTLPTQRTTTTRKCRRDGDRFTLVTRA